MAYEVNDDGFQARATRVKPGVECAACEADLHEAGEAMAATSPGYFGCRSCFEDGSLQAQIERDRRAAERDSEPYRGTFPGFDR